MKKINYLYVNPNKYLLLHNFWTRKLVREMDGLNLISVVGDIMHHLIIQKTDPKAKFRTPYSVIKDTVVKFYNQLCK